MKDKTYWIGLTLISLTFLACVISFWLLIYGIFIFAIGAFLVFFSKKSVQTKLLTAILPIIIYLPTTYLFLHGYNYTTPKTFLIPADYQGQLRIVYEQKCGEKLYKENGRQLLQFPESGILILNEKFDGGINNEYYLVDKNGRHIKIEQSVDPKAKSRKLAYILVGGAGTLAAEGNDEITFSDFYLYNKDTTQGEDFRAEQRFDSLTTEAVKACRIK